MNEKKSDSIRLTSKVLKSLNPAEIIYAEFADFGAMGACGTARIFALENGKLNFYLTGDTFHNKTDEKYLNEAAKYLLKLKEDKILDYANGGFGNAAFKKRGIMFTRDDDNYSFIYEDAGKKYAIPTSVAGIYERIVAKFAARKITIEDLENHFEKHRFDLKGAESDFCEVYIEQIKRFDSGHSYFDFSPTEYYDAVNFIKHLNCQEFLLNWCDESKCRKALQKYKLQYVVKKLGWNRLNDIFAALVENDAFDIFAKIDCALGEKIEKVYDTLETKNFSDSKMSKKLKDDPHFYYHGFSQLFSEPVLVDFAPSENKKICDDILKQGGGSLRAGTYGFYFANYLLNEDKFSYAEILPAVAHIIKTLPFDDFNGTHTEDLFYLCGEIIDNCWRYISEEKSVQKYFRDFVYEIYWPRVGALWPIVHRKEFEFGDPAGGKMFDDATNFVLSLKDIDERNAEIKEYLEKVAEDIDYATPLGRRVLCYAQKDIVEPEEELAAIMEQVRPEDWGSFLSYPETIKEAELLLAEIFNTKKNAKMSDLSTRLSVLEALILTFNADGVGEYILSYLHDNFSKLAKIVSTGGAENDKSILSDLFVAACKGVSEENELEPLMKFKEDLVGCGCLKKKLDYAEKYARKHQKTVGFQRKELTPLFRGGLRYS